MGKMLTIVIPSFNEKDRLPQFLKKLVNQDIIKKVSTIIVVDDGSLKESAEIIACLCEDLKRQDIDIEFCRRSINGGKGAAILTGIKRSKTAYVGFVDADGAVGSESIAEVVQKLINSNAQNQQIDGIIGSRIKMLGKDVKRSAVRHYIGRIFATYISLLLNIPVYDSQCGCKFFKSDILKPILPHITDQRWLFDTQVLILLYHLGYNIIEYPVDWRDIRGTKISLVKDSVKMFQMMLRFRYKLRSILNNL
jgi:glycosyltransferase involved in cell wall biosynthesis